MSIKIFRVADLATAHQNVVKHILEKGTIRETEDDESTIETDTLGISVTDPLGGSMVCPMSPQKQLFVSQYSENLIHGSDSEFVYDYYSRLRKGNDQIQYIIDNLKRSPQSRRSVAITWKPDIDQHEKDVPCLQLVYCEIRNGKLCGKVVFRSNDMLSALGANMYGIVMLLKYIADEIGVELGEYTHISLNPHIYYKRDRSELVAFCKKMNIKPKAHICKGCDRNCWKFTNEDYKNSLLE